MPVLDDALLTLDELCRMSAVSPQWVIERVQGGLLQAEGDQVQAWRFDALALGRVRHMRRVERDFDAVPELAALVADLLDEVQRLRTRLRRAGLD
jgi:chaperone modulatory protein CbpM